MVFAPTRGASFDVPGERTSGPGDPAPWPIQPDGIVRPPSESGPRLAWRAFVHLDGRETAQVAWHLAACGALRQPIAHCPEGQRRLETSGDPEGHCLVDDQCLQCAQQR
jgi:hypothetical protein